MKITSKNTFTSPFPDKQRNKSLVNFSSSMILNKKTEDKDKKIYKHTNFTTNDKPEKIKVDVSPCNLKKYMHSNTFYYDLKNWKEYNKPTHISIKTRLKSADKLFNEPIFKEKKESKNF